MTITNNRKGPQRHGNYKMNSNAWYEARIPALAKGLAERMGEEKAAEWLETVDQTRSATLRYLDIQKKIWELDEWEKELAAAYAEAYRIPAERVADVLAEVMPAHMQDRWDCRLEQQELRQEWEVE